MLSGPLKIVICLALFLLNFFLLPKAALYEDIETCVFANKAPCFTRDLGPLLPSSRQLQSPGPGLQRQ